MATESMRRATAATALNVSSTTKNGRVMRARKKALGPDPKSVVGNGSFKKGSDF